MKKNKVVIDSKSFWIGYSKGKKNAIEKIRKFIEEESEFLPDVHTDGLLDRLANVLKKI